MPLNSAHNSWPIGRALELTSSGSIDDQRLMVKGKFSKLGHEPCS